MPPIPSSSPPPPLPFLHYPPPLTPRTARVYELVGTRLFYCVGHHGNSLPLTMRSQGLRALTRESLRLRTHNSQPILTKTIFTKFTHHTIPPQSTLSRPKVNPSSPNLLNIMHDIPPTSPHPPNLPIMTTHPQVTIPTQNFTRRSNNFFYLAKTIHLHYTYPILPT